MAAIMAPIVAAVVVAVLAAAAVVGQMQTEEAARCRCFNNGISHKSNDLWGRYQCC